MPVGAPIVAHVRSVPSSKALALAVVLALGLSAGAARAQAPGASAPPSGPSAGPSVLGPQAAPGAGVPAAAPQGAYPAPGTYAPAPGPYAPYAMPVPGYLPPAYGPGGGETWKRKSPAMIGVGITLLSVGTISAVLGSAFYSIGAKSNYNQCYALEDSFSGDCAQPTDKGLRGGGIAMIAIGTLAVAAGIPVLAIGLRKVAKNPAPPSGASLLPEIRVGANGAQLAFRF